MHEILCGGNAYAPTKVVCVGKNFSDHAREMGGGLPPAEPVIFIKPNSSIATSPSEVSIPEALGLLHHEVELCALLGKRAKDVAERDAGALIAGWAVGIDFTLRDLQAAAKKSGAPWALAKGFDSAAVLGEFVPVSEAGDTSSIELSLDVNGGERQRGGVRHMIFSPAAIMSYASRFMTLEAGDVFMLGTPAGVGEISDGDRVSAAASGLPPLEFIVRRKGE